MRAINVLLSLLVILVIGALALEGGLRLIGRGPAPTLNRFDSELGWSKVPGRDMHRRGDAYSAHFEINELGLRDDPMSSPAKAPGTFRVIALGDSFTLGYTVERDELFVDLLERDLRAAGTPIDFVNAGTEGYSTDQEARWLDVHGAAFQPDLVLLFPYENDIYWNGQSNYLRFPKPRYAADGTLEPRELVDPGPRPLVDRWAVAGLLKPFFAKEKQDDTFPAPRFGQGVRNEFAPLLTAPPAFVAEAEARTRGALLALKQRCAALGATLVVAPIPSNSSVDAAFSELFGSRVLRGPRDAWSADRPVDFFLGACAELGIQTLDARPELRQRTRAGEKLYLDLFADREWHFTPAGNAAFAEFLRVELDRLGVLPATAHGAAPIALASTEAGGGLPFWLKLYLALWLVLTLAYALTYPKEPRWTAPLTTGVMLGLVFGIFIGGGWLVRQIPPAYSGLVMGGFVALVLGFVAWKLGSRLMTIFELLKAFVLRGHWYLMPLVVVLLTIGSLLVVAASSPLIAPFIYTLF